MHNLDRTNPEWGETMESFESFEQGESESGFETGTFGETFELHEMSAESPFNETQEMELAAELLEITNEEELNYFLGNLIKKAAGAVGKVVKSPIGRALGGVLKNVAKTALPMAGAALGNMVLPGIGGAIGGKLASTAGSMFGLELEGLSAEDREFEVARRFVRFAGAATRKSVSTPRTVPPSAAVRRAVSTAARRYAPGLASAVAGNQNAAAASADPYGFDDSSDAVNFGPPTVGPSGGGVGRSGRWVRRGRRIVLLGL